MHLYLGAVSGGLSLSDGKPIPLSSHKEDTMVQCFHHYGRGKQQAATWIYGVAGLGATRPEVLYCSQRFLAGPSVAHFSSRAL